MNSNLKIAGSISAIFGVFICAISGLARITGSFYILGFQSTTLFNVGVGIMVFACLVKLEEIAAQGRD